MEQIKLAEVSAELDHEAGKETAEKDVRTLKDLEMVLVGGGSDGVVCW